MTEPCVEQREALFAAVEKGDVAAIEALFTRDSGLRSQIELAERPLVRRFDDSTVYSWFFMPPLSLKGKYQNKNICKVAVHTGQYDVLQWLFSSERVPLLRGSLEFVWSSTAEDAIYVGNLEMLQLLLEAASYIYPQKQLQSEFCRLVSCSRNGDTIRMLLAHGACVPSEFVTSPTSKLVDVFKIEGAKVLSSFIFLDRLDVMHRVLQFGVNWGRNKDAYHFAAKFANLDHVKLHLTEGFVDMDIRDKHGKTALMLAVSSKRSHLTNSGAAVAEVVRILLDTGADVSLKDEQGWAPLHHALRSEFPEVSKILLEHGADNSAVITNEAFLDKVVNDPVRDAVIYDQIDLLLTHGADSYTKLSSGRVSHRPAGGVPCEKPC